MYTKKKKTDQTTGSSARNFEVSTWAWYAVWRLSIVSSVSIFSKNNLSTLPKKFKIDWSERVKKKKKMAMMLKRKCPILKSSYSYFVQFCLVLSSAAIVKKSTKKLAILIFQKIRVTISLDGTFILMQKPVLFQV